MCGIAGIIGARSTTLGAGIRRMTKHLKHRGPDDQGEFSDDWLAVGHRRLSILDLTAEGRQPIWSADGRHAIVYNGEVYNFASIRKQLQDAGYTFRSKTDSEVILNAYLAWGKDCVLQFNGMFAFAIYDSQAKKVFLARDRMGIKPLYYAQTEDGVLLFASEVRAILNSGMVPRRLNRKIIPYYLTYQTVPAPNTLIEGIQMLLPGHHMTVTPDGLDINRYWHLLENANVAAQYHNEDTVRKEINQRLMAAVERRLVSDVPIGAFLSGGIDSSVIVGLMSRLQDQPVNTFSVAFDHPDFQDGQYARLIARRFRTRHQEVTLSYEDILGQIPEALSVQDQPSGDGINTYIVSKAVQESGLTVALSGLGGDELFAGYSLFKRLMMQQRALFLWKWMPRMLRGQFARMLYAVNPSVATQKLKTLMVTNGSLAEVYPLGRQCFSSDQVMALLSMHSGFDDPYTALLNQTFSTQAESALLSKISFAEARTYMHDVLLRDTDQMSMAHGLEVRVPFLDHDLVEYVMGVRDEIKEPGSIPKRLLVESMGDLLPHDVVHRPKQGFFLPFDEWMRGPLQHLCEGHLDALAKLPEFSSTTIQSYWQSFLKGEKVVSWSRLWLLIALGAWCQKNMNA